VLQARNLYTRDRLEVDCVKMFLDGVPTESHTAAMLEPYASSVHGRDDEASRKGLLLMSQEAIARAVIRFDRMGLAVKFHAAGDAAVRAGLNGIEAARQENGFSGTLHDVGHSTFVSKADLPRARALGATFEVSPYLWSPSPITDEFITAIGPERIERIWPMREMLTAGALVIPGSDWSVVPSVNPWIAVEELVTREQLGGSERSFGKGETIDLQSAIDLFTINSARHRHLESQVGRIAPGMLADVIVIGQDPFAVPRGKLHEIEVMTTIINGDVVFQR
jgi:predicted amidohydrolase YtcJ